MTATTIFVIKEADESKYDQTVDFADDPELVLSLEEGASYWLEIGLLGGVANVYASRLSTRLQYSGVLYDPGVHILSQVGNATFPSAYPTGGRVGTLLSQAAFDSGEYTVNNAGGVATQRGAFWYSGRITCFTAGDLRVQWKHYDNGFAGSSFPSTLFAGSWMCATPLDICPI